MGLVLNWSTWMWHTTRGLCSPTLLLTPTTKHTNKKILRGTFADRHALWDIKKGIVNKPSQLHKQEPLIPKQYKPLDALTHQLCTTSHQHNK